MYLESKCRNKNRIIFLTRLSSVIYLHLETINIISVTFAGCKVNVSDMEQLSPLHVAAMRDRVEEARVLIQAGAKVNTKSSDKMAPLHFAAARGFTEMVTLLIQGGANLDPLDSSDRTPLYLAVTRSHFDIVEMLLECGAKVNIEEVHGILST